MTCMKIEIFLNQISELAAKNKQEQNKLFHRWADDGSFVNIDRVYLDICPRNSESVCNCVVCDNYWVDSLCDSNTGELTKIHKSLWLGVDCNSLFQRFFQIRIFFLDVGSLNANSSKNNGFMYNSISFHSGFTNPQSQYTFRAKVWFHKNHFGKLTIHSKFQSLDLKNFKYIIKRAAYIYEAFSYFSFGLCYCRYFSYTYILIFHPVSRPIRRSYYQAVPYSLYVFVLTFVFHFEILLFYSFFHFSLTKLITTTNYKYI